MSNRYVILHHLAPSGEGSGGEHWDLMLEVEESLVTWQLLAEPNGRGACPIVARRIQDHRKHYLAYEGEISGGRGVVSRFDEGRYELLASCEDSWRFRLGGGRFVGDFRIVRDVAGGDAAWVLEAV